MHSINQVLSVHLAVRIYIHHLHQVVNFYLYFVDGFLGLAIAGGAAAVGVAGVATLIGLALTRK